MNRGPIEIFDGLLGDSLAVYHDRITLKHKGIADLVVLSIQMERTIYLKDVASVQLEQADAAWGCIRIHCPAAGAKKNSKPACEVYTIKFKNLLNDEAAEFTSRITDKVLKLKDSPPGSRQAPAAPPYRNRH